MELLFILIGVVIGAPLGFALRGAIGREVHKIGAAIRADFLALTAEIRSELAKIANKV